MYHFSDPLWLCLLPTIPIVYWIGKLRRKTIKFSSAALQSNLRAVSWVGVVHAVCFYVGFAAFAIALAQPTIFMKVDQESIEARDFMLVVDTSDSMEWGMVDPTIADGFEKGDKPSIHTGKRANNIVLRINAAQVSILEFLNQRDGDRVGFLVFDMRTYFGWPLTTDLDIVRKRMEGLPTYVGAGTEFDGKSNPIGSAIKHFDEMGQSKSKVIVMVTDGEGEIDPKRIEALAVAIQKRDIKLYVIGIGYKPFEEVKETADLRNLVSKVNGKVIDVTDVEKMRIAFAELNSMEKSTIELESKLEPVNISHWFMIMGLAFLSVFGLFTLLSHDEL